MTNPHSEPKLRIKEVRQQNVEIKELENQVVGENAQKKEDVFAQFESRFDKQKVLTPFFKTVSRENHFFTPNHTIETPGPNLYRPKPVLKNIHSIPNFGRDLQSKLLTRKVLDVMVRMRETNEKSKEPTEQKEHEIER